MKIITLALLTLAAGCTSIDVRQVPAAHKINHVCIKNNPKVTVTDFVQVVEDVFNNHSITTEIYNGNTPEHCQYNLSYTALRSWDLSTYLSHAELRLYKGVQRIGYAEYHLIGKGGLALNKWASVKSKMTPVINKLLSQH